MLNEEQSIIRDTARQYAAEKLAPFAAERDQACDVPRGVIEEMGALGLLGVTVDPEWGGAGADHVAYVLALEAIAGGDGGVSTVMSLTNSPVGAILETYGTKEQKERYLKPMVAGELTASFALTEPHTGSDASNLKTRAQRKGNHWVINGTKQFISAGAASDVCMTFVVTDPEAGKKGISAFMVPTDADGYVVAAKEKKLGQRSVDLSQIIYDNMEVTPDTMLGEEGQGYKIALQNLSTGRIGIGAQSTGFAQAAYEAALAYAKEREAFGKPIIEHQAVAWRLADMATEIEAARQLVLNAARLKDAGEPCLKEASMAKLFASEMAERVCSAAIQTFGGYGYTGDFPVERYYRDCRVCQIYEGTSDVQRMLISRTIAAGG
jgi:alkylation response protein AidB-like acyl-CoA dehydrogenase